MIIEYIRHVFEPKSSVTVLRVDTDTSSSSQDSELAFSKRSIWLSWDQGSGVVADRVVVASGWGIPSPGKRSDEVRIISGSGPLPRVEYMLPVIGIEFVVHGTRDCRTGQLSFDPDALREIGLVGYTLAKEMIASAVAAMRR